ncbi:MAG: hypothetical protein Q7K39_00640 [Candidatus Magasanikbacteria bacterium]|nr:hypothetical protein [Candidatus Magasanikbacteria bacterium]
MKKNTQLIVAGVLAVVAGALAYGWLTALARGQELVLVVALAHDVEKPAMLGESDFIFIKVPRASLPNGVLFNKNQAIGKTLSHSAPEKYILNSRDFANRRDSSSESMLVPPGFVGMVIPANWLAAPLPKIKPHDLVSVFAAVPITKQGGGVSLQVVSAAEVLAVRSDKDLGPQGVYLALPSPVAERLLQLKAAQLLLLIVAESGLTNVTASQMASTSVGYGT